MFTSINAGSVSIYFLKHRKYIQCSKKDSKGLIFINWNKKKRGCENGIKNSPPFVHC